MGSDMKQPSFSPEYHESSQFDHNERHPGPSRALEAGRMGLSILALASAVGILATSAHNLKIYNDTHVSNEFLLPLWPFEFNLGPSIALVACGSIMIVAAAMSLLAGKIPSVRPPYITRPNLPLTSQPVPLQHLPPHSAHSPVCLLWPRFRHRRNLLLLRRQRLRRYCYTPELVMPLVRRRHDIRARLSPHLQAGRGGSVLDYHDDPPVRAYWRGGHHGSGA